MIATFQPKLGIYHVLGRGEMRGREGALMIPAELDGLITGIDGLDQRQMAYRHAAAQARARRRTSAKTKIAAKRRRAAAAPAAIGSGPSGRPDPSRRHASV